MPCGARVRARGGVWKLPSLHEAVVQAGPVKDVCAEAAPASQEGRAGAESAAAEIMKRAACRGPCVSVRSFAGPTLSSKGRAGGSVFIRNRFLHSMERKAKLEASNSPDHSEVSHFFYVDIRVLCSSVGACLIGERDRKMGAGRWALNWPESSLKETV